VNDLGRTVGEGVRSGFSPGERKGRHARPEKTRNERLIDRACANSRQSPGIRLGTIGPEPPVDGLCSKATRLLLFGVTRFALMPDRQNQHDVLGR